MQTCTAGVMCMCEPLIYGWAIEGGTVVNVISSSSYTSSC